jgi:hypothetical protein
LAAELLHLLLAGAGWGAEPPACPDGRVTAQAVDGWLAEAEEAFADLDIDGFLARSDRVRAALPCIDRVVPTRVAARLHRTEGLRRFGERQVDSVRAFAAARALEPDYTFDPRVVPPGNPILEDYAAMDLTAADPEDLPEPRRGTLYVDGLRTRERAQAWPAVVQVARPGRQAVLTALVEHHQPVPSYPTESSRRGATTVALGLATGAAAITSGAALTAAWLSYDAWSDPAETHPDRLDALRNRTNTMSAASGVGAACAVGLGTALVVTWW